MDRDAQFHLQQCLHHRGHDVPVPLCGAGRWGGGLELGLGSISVSRVAVVVFLATNHLP